MKHKIPSRLLAMLLVVVMVLSMLPTIAFAAPESYGKVLINSAEDLTAGTYLIRGVGSSALDDGTTTTAFMSSTMDASGRLTGVALPVEGTTVTTEDKTIVWELVEAEGGFLVKNAADGKYLSWSTELGGGNKIYQTDDPATSSVWHLTSKASADGASTYWGLQETVSGRVLSINRFGSTGSRYHGFAGYTSVMGGGLEFYRLGASGDIETVAAPTASVASGEAEVGTLVTLSCATDGAAISYKINDGAWTAYETPILIDRDLALTVRATKAGMANSPLATYTYTAWQMLSGYGKTDSVQAGDKVVIYAPGVGIAISADATTGNYRAGVEMTPSDSGSFEEDAVEEIVVWEVAPDGEFFTFTNGGKKLCYGYYSGMGMPLDGPYPTWKIVPAETEGCVYLTSTGGNQMYATWDVEHADFTMTNTPEEANSALQLYKYSNVKVYVGADPTVKQVKAPTAEPVSGEYKAGTKIAFACQTDGATILYHTGDGNYKEYTAPIAITENTTFTVKGARLGMSDSDEVTFAYTIRPYMDVKDALDAAEGSFTVRGVVTFVGGKDVYVQDETGAICARMAQTPAGVALGDTILVTGARATADGLPVLDAATFAASEGLSLNAKQTTIGELGAADICSYVYIKNLEITAIENADGNPTLTVKDADGATIRICDAVVGKNEDGSLPWKTGELIDVTLAVGYSTAGGYCLRNTVGTEIVSALGSDRITSLSGFTSGSYVMVIGSLGYAPEHLDGVWLSYVEPKIVDGEKVVDAKGGIWTLTVEGDEVIMTDHNGYAVAPLGGAQNGITGSTETQYKWRYEFDEEKGTFRFFGQGADQVILTCRGDQGYRFRAMKCNNGISTNKNYYVDFTLYQVDPEQVSPPKTELPAAGDKVVIYNELAEGALAAQDDNTISPAILPVTATVTDTDAKPNNGAVVFTAEENGEYYRFYNETYGYLCSNGTGNNAFYSKEASENADWTVSVGNRGYYLGNRTAKYEDNVQYLQFFADKFVTFGMQDATDFRPYTFQFYPVAEGVNVNDGIVNLPAVKFTSMEDAYATVDYVFSFTVDAVFGVKELTVKVGGEEMPSTEKDGVYTVTVPAAKVVGTTMTLEISGVDNKGAEFSRSADVTVKDEPLLTNPMPAAGAETGDDKRPTISIDVANAGEAPTIVMTVRGETVEHTYKDGRISYTPAEDLADGSVPVVVTVTRKDGVSASKSWRFNVGKSELALYFGQLHAHNGEYSDGSGTLDEALNYIAGLPEEENVDFVAFTDHSNYFDKSGEANPEGALYDMTLATDFSRETWNRYTSTIDAFNNAHTNVIALAGFEMTWSGGPGHMNTFNTSGIVSRNNTTLNNKNNNAGMQSYYKLLSQPEGEGSLTQFNHPGNMFGTFGDFAFYDETIDQRIFMVEVGNGAGAIGSSGYFPSYEYYTMALDKGWHLAPTNNQDNHGGHWGNANTARDVVLTDDFSEEGIWEAIRNYRMYATEDKNLELHYTVNDQQLGTIMQTKPDSLNVKVSVFDPDEKDKIAKVEVVVNSGVVAYTWNSAEELAAGELECTLEPTYSYYFIRVTEADGDLAVTAPVWVGDVVRLGITSVTSSTALPVAGEKLTLTTSLFNSESTPATVKSVTYTTNGAEVIGTDTTGYTVAANGTLAIPFEYTPATAKATTITVTVVMEQDGVEYTYKMSIELDVMDAADLCYVGIDASHGNEYVSGSYSKLVGEFTKLAADGRVSAVLLTTSEELLAACADSRYKAIILTAPSRMAGADKDYSAAEIAALKSFNAAGGALVVTGWADKNDAAGHMAAAQNALLEALGTALRISDDTMTGGATVSGYGKDSFLLAGIDDKPYSNYGGSTIYVAGDAVPATVTPVVYGDATTASADNDSDGLGGVNTPKYPYAEGDDRLLIMATDAQEGKGLILVAGGAFMNDFELGDASDAKNTYSNYTLCENLIAYLNPPTITPIADVQADENEGVRFTIEGVVTSNASGYDQPTAFFDCIYLQDETAGINAFPVDGNFKIGDKVRITGKTSSYQGERQISVEEIALLSENNEVTPKQITAAQLNDGSVLGSLVTLSGVVESIQLADGLVQTIMVKDAAGTVGRVFIDGYITTSKEIKDLAVGASITVTGLASYDNTIADAAHYARIRVRDRADVVCGEHVHEWGEWVMTVAPTCTKAGEETRTCKLCGEKETRQLPMLDCAADRFTDVDTGKWYHEAVDFVVANDLMKGISDTTFEPNSPMTRGMLVTILYRAEGEPDVAGIKHPFTDVAERRYFTKPVAWAYDNDIVKGITDTTFEPDTKVSREQLATILFRYAEAEAVEEDHLKEFPDAEKVHNYAKAALNWAVAEGLITGNKTGDVVNLDPRESATRAQIATILMRYLQNAE